MDVQHAATPIFTDASGRRATVLLWVARGLCACFVLVTGAVAFTLLTQVSLPGLGGLVGPESAARPPSAADGSSADGKGAFDAARRSLSNTPMDVAAAGSRSEPRTSAVPSAADRSGRAEVRGRLGPARRDSPERAGDETSEHTTTGHDTAAGLPTDPAPTPAPVKGANSQGTTRSGSANPSARDTAHAPTGAEHQRGLRSGRRTDRRADDDPPGRTK